MRSSIMSLAFIVAVLAGVSAQADESCNQALNRLVGRDNSQNNDAFDRKSVVKGNWSASCVSPELNGEACTLSAACANGQKQVQPRSSIDLKVCAQSPGEVRNLGGQLVCWCGGPNTVCPPVAITKPAVVPPPSSDDDSDSSY